MAKYNIPKDIETIFERHDINVLDLDDNCVEVEGFTDSGGDMIHHLYVKSHEVGNIKRWCEEWEDMTNAFKPSEETAKWCVDGYPVNTPFNTAEELYHDIADYWHDTLYKVCRELKDLANGESPDKVKKYLIDFKLTVSTARVIAATSEDEAVRIAEEMIGEDDYWDGVVESMNNDWGNWDSGDADVFCLERVDDGEDADNE